MTSASRCRTKWKTEPEPAQKDMVKQLNTGTDAPRNGYLTFG